jgi:hypothetical protein
LLLAVQDQGCSAGSTATPTQLPETRWLAIWLADAIDCPWQAGEDTARTTGTLMITVPIFIATLQNVLMEFPDLPPNCLQRTPSSSGSLKSPQCLPRSASWTSIPIERRRRMS